MPQRGFVSNRPVFCLFAVFTVDAKAVQWCRQPESICHVLIEGYGQEALASGHATGH